MDRAPQQYGDPNNALSDIQEIKRTYINNGHGGTGWTLQTAWQPVDLLYDYLSNGAGYERVETVRGRLIDLDGDGLPEWVRAYNDYNSSTSTFNHMKTWRNTGSGWVVDAGYKMPDVFAHYRGVYSIPHGQFVDVNGDGLVDWVQARITRVPRQQNKRLG